MTSDGEGVEKLNLVHCWWECKMVQPLWKTVWWFLKKVNIELSQNYHSTSRVYTEKELKTGTPKGICTLM